MSMRYLIRRSKPEDFADVKVKVPDLDKQLGPAGEGYKRIVSLSFSPVRHAHYHFFARKNGEAWKWVSTGIEFDVEDEQVELFF